MNKNRINTSCFYLHENTKALLLNLHFPDFEFSYLKQHLMSTDNYYIKEHIKRHINFYTSAAVAGPGRKLYKNDKVFFDEYTEKNDINELFS